MTATRPPLRVLVAEDYTDTRKALCLLLRSWGCEAREAADGREALRLAEQFRPDVALLDIAMPHLGGCAVARGLRGGHGSPRPTLVALTAYSDAGHVREAVEADFDHFLAKPCEPAQLEFLLLRLGRERAGPAAAGAPSAAAW